MVVVVDIYFRGHSYSCAVTHCVLLLSVTSRSHVALVTLSCGRVIEVDVRVFEWMHGVTSAWECLLECPFGVGGLEFSLTQQSNYY